MNDLTSLPWILPLKADLPRADLPPSQAPDLQAVGGKGANLARLAQAGFPVPPGFLISTRAYRDFVTANQLEEPILAVLPTSAAEDLTLLEAASARIRVLFAEGRIPGELAAEILDGYRRMGEPAVAVRSSATAEDLPEMSFAGQQDTYLNILGPEQLLKAVVNCWSSLWTARAIGYRLRNQVPQEGAALAVVVQKMVESQASGVLFTANPLTGLRTETVIDATLGLGEALVSGQVEPDHYVVDTAGGRVTAKKIGAKAISIRSQAGGGTAVLREAQQDIPALSDDQVLDLARLGQQVAALYGFPQDIEWAWADGQLYLLQSRPVTSLFPTPAGMPAEPLKVFMSFAAVQGMMDPVTPLGRDSLSSIFATGAGMFGSNVTSETQSILFTAAERIWINITPVVKNSVGRRIAYFALGNVEPSVQQAIQTIWDDPRLLPPKKGISLRALLSMSGFFPRLAGNIFLNMLFPTSRRKMILENGENVLEEMRAHIATVSGDRYARLARQVRLLSEIDRQLPRTLILFISGVATGMAALSYLHLLAKTLPGKPAEGHALSSWDDRVLEITRGLPYNPTTEMDLLLWETAQAIRRDPVSMQEFQAYSANDLAARYQSGQMAPAARQVIGRFLEKYGGRGLGEIDMGRPRWREAPAHVFEMLSGYLLMDDPDQAPDVLFARGAATAQENVEQLAAALRKTRLGWLKAKLARFFAYRVREIMGIRESPKFFAVRMMGLIRFELLKTGAEFAQSGELEQADDLMYLTYAELEAFAAREGRDWRALIARRRQEYQRELLRRQIPRLLLSDGRAFYEGLSPAEGAGSSLTGSPVSPGSVEGRVRVVFDPRQANLLPGEILVCRGTDPSWTPLFLTAAGLVMEVGGMMTHGAVVAREYGIPAVVGVDQATSRLQTGQRIALNGSTGLITLLEEEVETVAHPTDH